MEEEGHSDSCSSAAIAAAEEVPGSCTICAAWMEPVGKYGNSEL